MNITEVIEEINNTIKAYLYKNSKGGYRISIENQKPILLIGESSVDKLSIINDIIKENKLELVNINLINNSKESIVGAPIISEKNINGKDISVLSYTISKIMLSVYEKIEDSSIKEGIIYIDKLEFISESLMKNLINFFQYKTIGEYKLPEGWVIILSASSLENNGWNKSICYSLSRVVRKLYLEEDFLAWKKEAYKRNVNGMVISFLELNTKYFYLLNSEKGDSVAGNGKEWVNIGGIIDVYEELNLKIDAELIYQYINDRDIASDFMKYVGLYNSYKRKYIFKNIINGLADKHSIKEFEVKDGNERSIVISLLLGEVWGKIRVINEKEIVARKVFEMLKQLKAFIGSEENNEKTFGEIFDELLEEDNYTTEMISQLEEYKRLVIQNKISNKKKAFEYIKSEYNKNVEYRKKDINSIITVLENTFSFIEKIFGKGHEMNTCIQELSINPYSEEFIKANGCGRYSRYVKGNINKMCYKNIKSNKKEYAIGIEEIEKMIKNGIENDDIINQLERNKNNYKK